MEGDPSITHYKIVELGIFDEQNGIIHLLFESSDLRDYVLHTTVEGFVRGNFTPTSPSERPCHEEPYFLPKHRPERSKHLKKHNEFRTKSDSVSRNNVYTNSDSMYINSDGVYTNSDSVYFRPKNLKSRGERSLRVGKSVRFRRRFLPARVVAGPLEERSAVVLQWAMDDVHLDKEEASVVFR
ncbi:Endonuclease-reverse transcriptase [Operophtera brumata]|uniref:Endonuclease-reverse transcriptase n=1 Tax=Operophtera brumata TaxID=104452 RepID=A0A0L7LT98_OPEBR|nr:Endonuclease-reverse transcriptase [Operophtera brumata]